MYIRTLCNSIKAVESSEKTKVMELAVSSKISELLSGKLSSKQEEKTITILEETFAEYDEYTAEEDLISILGQIQNERNQEWLGRRVTKRMSNLMEEIVSDLSRFILGDRRKLRILFIVDELDKLEAEGCDHIINILKSMKELFSSTSSKFILISGRTTYTQADDYLVQEFENIYKGVVADIIYLPCVWDESKLICDQIFDISKMDDGTSKWYEKVFKEYLIYASRGNIRGIFRLINKYKHKSHIEIPPEEKERIHAYAEIQSALMMKVFPETYSWADEFRDDYILEVYRILDIVLRLNPDDLISVDGNTLTCYGKQYGWLTEPFTTKYGVEVNTLFMMLVNQGFMRKTSEPNSISKKEKKAKEVVYLVTDKVLILRHGLIVIDSADFEPGLSVAVSVGTTNLNSLQPIPCSYCLSPILGGEEIITCPSCQSVYHVTCWTFNGGCSVLGCQKNPLLN